MNLLTKLFGSRNKKNLKKITPLVKSINDLEGKYSKMDDDGLRNQKNLFIKQYESGISLDDLLVESFAVAREVAKRKLNLRPYDCQLMGGIALHNCQIAEMATGEGKTLVATLPSYLNSFTKRKVILITANDYLAKRDANWMKPVYEGLDLKVSYVVSGQSFEERKEAYSNDVIYATNNEIGFDYLRNNLVLRKEERMLNDFFFAIVDEVDSILIDEARTPLVISGASEDTSKIYQEIGGIIPKLKEKKIAIADQELTEDEDGHFIVDEKSKQVELTNEGHDYLEKILKSSGMLEEGQSLYSATNLKMLHYIQSSLRAHFLFKRDVDYLIQENQIILIDENTGRAMPGRRLADGLHQAIEQKEGVQIQMESQTLASSTFQNYFRQYEKLAGMTGTASTESQEFSEIYGLNVIEIPTNLPMIRTENNDVVYLTKNEKYSAVVEEISNYRNKGNPVLVGTSSLESSETISDLLKSKKIEHQVLNAKNHAREAEVIAQAGKPGVVTIATNMAGRGTDIVLGGNLESELEQRETIDSKSKEKLFSDWKERNKKVLDAGGLHVIGTERNESRRVDNQLRGRSGRQGDPGSSRFYLSLEDDLMRIFASELFKNIMQNLGLENGEAIEHRMLSGAIQRAQKRVEGRNFDLRKLLLEYDDMANEQRQIIYSQRDLILDSEDISELLDSMRETVIQDQLRQFIPDNVNEQQWDIRGLEASIQNDFGISIPVERWIKENPNLDEKELTEKISSIARENYKEKAESIGPAMRDFEKQILLQVIDNSWKEHLGAIEYLRQGIGLRGYASKNPKLEFRRESFELFETLLENIRTEGIKFLSRVEIEVKDPEELAEKQREEKKEIYKHEEQSAFTNIEETKKIQRNPEAQPSQGNRRLRRYEAKMARKRGKK